MNTRAAIIVVLLACAGAARGQEASLRFEPAADTGLSEILKARRATLEARKGGALTGHEWWLWGLGAFDYDRDGDLDLIVCIHGSTNGVILRNQSKETGRTSFVDVTEALGVDGFVPSTDNYPLVWDFDGDGYLDIAGLLNDTQTPCLLNREGKRFDKAAYSLHPINYPDAIEDLNGDGYVDIQQTVRSRVVRFTYDPRAARFVKSESDAPPPIAVPDDVRAALDELHQKKDNRFLRTTYLRADLDGDGRDDCALRAFASYSGDRLGWYLLAAGDGGAYHDRTAEMGLPRDGAPMAARDVDGDGDVDLLIASSDQAGLYLNDGKGRFTLQPGPLTDFIKQRCPYLQVAFHVDLDNDGDEDIAVSNRRYGTQRVFENKGDGRFVLAMESKGWDADPLVLRDINDDGLVDLIIGGAGEKENIGIYLNRTPNAGRSCRLLLRMDPPNVYAAGAKVELYSAGDLDRDNARQIRVAHAPLDGSPVHVGLGKADSFDLRITFPGRAPVMLRRQSANAALTITPDGAR